ncbi:short chain dehydrogenase [Colletotrichum kahawae]|uniref:Short chain dehydrogenase n=1 Tax=Colletotrichum kahawae TaxID=34407 RepID=A0AAD9Y5Z3_COLKA|nr:short chain dehydrogenase [Colletotrichum kahawae]
MARNPEDLSNIPDGEDVLKLKLDKALSIMRDENPKSGQQGRVTLNISSIGGWDGFSGQAFYHASKFAMEGWTESVAKELPTAWNTIYAVVSSGNRVPIRVPLRPDSWGLLTSDLESIRKDLDELKNLSLGLGDSKQLESIDFLRK